MTTKPGLLFQHAETYEIPTGPDGLSDELRRFVHQRLEQYILKVADGKCKVMESYADAVGYIRACKDILSYHQRVVEESQRPTVEDEDHNEDAT